MDDVGQRLFKRLLERGNANRAGRVGIPLRISKDPRSRLTLLGPTRLRAGTAGNGPGWAPQRKCGVQNIAEYRSCAALQISFRPRRLPQLVRLPRERHEVEFSQRNRSAANPNELPDRIFALNYNS